IPALIAALDDEPDVSANASVALSQIGPAAVQPLIRALAGTSDRTTVGAARALGGIGVESKPAIPDLVKALTTTKADVRIAVVEALGHIPDSASVKALKDQVLTDPDFGVRRSAAASLGRLGPEAKTAVPALVDTLRELNDLSKRRKP